jgi:hypothetical protein
MENYTLPAAASKGHLFIVRMLLDQWDKSDRALPGHEIGAALEEAASKGHDKVVTEFLRSKWDMTPHILRAMKGAASGQNHKIFETLFACWKQLRVKETPTPTTEPPFYRPELHGYDPSPSFNFAFSDVSCLCLAI